jgi:hypothetical protein
MSDDLVATTDFEFIVAKAANRRSWTVDCASFPIQLTCTLRTEFWSGASCAYFDKALLLTKARFSSVRQGETHPWSSRAQFLVVDLSKRLPRRWLNSIASAVLRLISWNFIGCSIGKSAGLALFNIPLTDSRK